MNKRPGRAVSTDVLSVTKRRFALVGGALALLGLVSVLGPSVRSVVAPLIEAPSKGLSSPETLALPRTNGPAVFAYDVAAGQPFLGTPLSPRAVVGPVATEESDWGGAPKDGETPGVMGPESEHDFSGSELDVVMDWRVHDRARWVQGPWNQFLTSWVDPLLTESDGLGFYDPSGEKEHSLLPVKLPRAYGFGVKFRASF